MILREATIRNIKSFYPSVTVEFTDDKGINLYVGPNSSGKSNLFEILQGAINNVFYFHCNIILNDKRTDKTSPYYDINYKIRRDERNADNYNNNIIDKHFNHLDEPSSIDLKWKINEADIDSVNQSLKHKDKLLKYIRENVVDEFGLIGVLENVKSKSIMKGLANKYLHISIINDQQTTITNLEDFTEKQKTHLSDFLELIRHINVFYELSGIYSALSLAPQSRYIGPHREVGSIHPSSFIDLSGLGTYEDVFSKGINANRDSGYTSVSTAPQRLASLVEKKDTQTLLDYNRYLKEYLKSKAIVAKNDVLHKIEYIVDFKRLNGSPMKLSSGEREFFSLISSLILSKIKDGVIFIDEPELHLHYKWQTTIMQLIEDLSNEYNLQFFVVTHSPQFINPSSIKYINHVKMRDGITIIDKPTRSILDNAKAKSLLLLLSSTNSERAFFSDKVVLVEGVSDMLVYTKIISIIQDRLKSKENIEVIPVMSKNNLLAYKNILSAWNIPCFAIGDFDFMNEAIKAFAKLLKLDTTAIAGLRAEIKRLNPVSAKKLKKVLSEESKDGMRFIDILLSKDSIPSKDFNESMDSLLTYLLTERAIKAQKNATLSQGLKDFIVSVASNENVFILRAGSLENYFKHYASEKLNNADEIVQHLSKVPAELSTIFRQIINSPS